MRKTDKSARLNKPSKPKILSSGIGALKPTKEEILERRNALDSAKKLSKNKKIIKLKQGFSYDFEKTKKQISQNKKKY